MLTNISFESILTNSILRQQKEVEKIKFITEKNQSNSKKNTIRIKLYNTRKSD